MAKRKKTETSKDTSAKEITVNDVGEFHIYKNQETGNKQTNTKMILKFSTTKEASHFHSKFEQDQDNVKFCKRVQNYLILEVTSTKSLNPGLQKGLNQAASVGKLSELEKSERELLNETASEIKLQLVKEKPKNQITLDTIPDPENKTSEDPMVGQFLKPTSMPVISKPPTVNINLPQLQRKFGVNPFPPSSKLVISPTGTNFTPLPKPNLKASGTASINAPYLHQNKKLATTTSPFSNTPVPTPVKKTSAPIINLEKNVTTYKYNVQEYYQLLQDQFDLLDKIFKGYTLVTDHGTPQLKEYLVLTLANISRLYQKFTLLTNALISTPDTYVVEFPDEKLKIENVLSEIKKQEFLKQAKDNSQDKGQPFVEYGKRLQQNLKNLWVKNEQLCMINLKEPETLSKVEEITNQIFTLFVVMEDRFKTMVDAPLRDNETASPTPFWSKPAFDQANREVRELTNSLQGFPPQQIDYTNDVIMKLVKAQCSSMSIQLAPLQSPFQDLKNESIFKVLLAGAIENAITHNTTCIIPVSVSMKSHQSVEANIMGVIITPKEDAIEIKFMNPKGSCCHKYTAQGLNGETLETYESVKDDLTILNLRAVDISKANLPLTISAPAPSFLKLFDANFFSMTPAVKPINLIFTGLIQQKSSGPSSYAYVVQNFIAELNKVPRQAWDELELNKLHLALLAEPEKTKEQEIQIPQI